MTASELIYKANMRPVSKARNLASIGWAEGYLVVRYKGKPTLYIHGPAIAEVEKDKILRSPYPDGLWSKLRKKHTEWKTMKVGE